MIDLKISVSVGELIDKLSILQIKMEKIIDKDKLTHIETEYRILKEVSEIFLKEKSISNLFDELFETNKILWNIENAIRKKDEKNEFDEEFIEIAKSVYKNNDKRFRLKNEINELSNSKLKEQKSY
jgi:hypothetical protein